MIGPSSPFLLYCLSVFSIPKYVNASDSMAHCFGIISINAFVKQMEHCNPTWRNESAIPRFRATWETSSKSWGYHRPAHLLLLAPYRISINLFRYFPTPKTDECLQIQLEVIIINMELGIQSVFFCQPVLGGKKHRFDDKKRHLRAMHPPAPTSREAS